MKKKKSVRDRNPKQDYQKKQKYMNKGRKWMKRNKSMNENIKEWTNKQIDRKSIFSSKRWVEIYL